MSQIERFDYLNCLQPNNLYLIEFLEIHSNIWNHLTVSSGSFKNDIKNVFTNYIYLIYIYKEYLALYNLQWLNAIKPNQTKSYTFNIHV